MASKTKRDAELDAAEQDRRSTLEVIVVPLYCRFLDLILACAADRTSIAQTRVRRGVVQELGEPIPWLTSNWPRARRIKYVKKIKKRHARAQVLAPHAQPP